MSGFFTPEKRLALLWAGCMGHLRVRRFPLFPVMPTHTVPSTLIGIGVAELIPKTKVHIMSNQSAARKNSSKARRILVLDPSQFALYQTGDIEVQSPTGEYLNTIGSWQNKSEVEVSMYRLQDQMHLIECLLRNGKYPLELNERAGAGLVEMLDRAQEFLQ